jgi:hypothetical protein
MKTKFDGERLPIVLSVRRAPKGGGAGPDKGKRISDNVVGRPLVTITPASMGRKLTSSILSRPMVRVN